jgi:hypothetical protein
MCSYILLLFTIYSTFLSNSAIDLRRLDRYVYNRPLLVLVAFCHGQYFLSCRGGSITHTQF